MVDRAGGGSAIYDVDGEDKPLIDVTREQLNLESGQIKTAARPRDMVMGGKKQNALSEQVPSTAVIPVQQWQPFTDEIIVGAAIIAAIMEYFSSNRDKSLVSIDKQSYPTQYVDLEKLRQEQERD
jgi:hypothetical protein